MGVGAGLSLSRSSSTVAAADGDGPTLVFFRAKGITANIQTDLKGPHLFVGELVNPGSAIALQDHPVAVVTPG